MKRICITYSMNKDGETVLDSFTVKPSDKVADKLISGEELDTTRKYINSLARARGFHNAGFVRAETV